MGSTIHFGQVVTPAALKRLQRLYLQTAMVGDLTYGQMANGMFDRFKDSDGIDGSSVYTLGTGYAGPVEELITGDYTAGTISGYPGNGNLADGETYVGTSAGLSGVPNNAIITKIGIATSTTSGTFKSKLCKQVSTDHYDIVELGTFSLTGGGYTEYTLSTPYTVPSSGQYQLGFYSVGTTMTGICTAASPTYLDEYVGEATGNNKAFSVSGGTGFPKITAIYHYYTPPTNMAIISNAVTALAVATKAIATVLMLNKHSSTKVYVSTASSPSWTELTGLTKVASTIGGVGIDQYSSDLITISGSADKSMRWKVETDAGHSTRCYGVALNWK